MVFHPNGPAVCLEDLSPVSVLEDFVFLFLDMGST